MFNWFLQFSTTENDKIKQNTLVLFPRSINGGTMLLISHILKYRIHHFLQIRTIRWSYIALYEVAKKILVGVRSVKCILVYPNYSLQFTYSLAVRPTRTSLASSEYPGRSKWNLSLHIVVSPLAGKRFGWFTECFVFLSSPPDFDNRDHLRRIQLNV